MTKQLSTRKRTYHLSTTTSDPSLPQKSQNPIRCINQDILIQSIDILATQLSLLHYHFISNHNLGKFIIS